MELIYLYFAVAIVVVVAGSIDILRPVLSEYELPTDIRVIYYIVFIVLGLLVAPVFLAPLFSKHRRDEFKLALHKTLFENN